MEARGVRRRAPPDVLRAYFQGLGEMHGHVLSALDRARGSFELQRSSGSGGGADGGAGRWEELPEAKQDRLLSAPFHDARVAARKYDEDDWGRAVLEIRKGAAERSQHEAWKLEIERIKKEQSGKKKRGGRRMTEANLPVGTPRQRVEIIPTASAAKTPSPKLEHRERGDDDALLPEFRGRSATAAGDIGRQQPRARRSVDDILKLQKDIRRSDQAASPRLISTSTVEKVARLADDLIEERHEEAARRGSMQTASSRTHFFPDSGGADVGSTTDDHDHGGGRDATAVPERFAVDVDSGSTTPTAGSRRASASEGTPSDATPRRAARATHVFRAQHTLNNYKGQRTSTAMETLKLLDSLDAADAETETDAPMDTGSGRGGDRRTSTASTTSGTFGFGSAANSAAASASSSRRPSEQPHQSTAGDALASTGRLLDALILEDDDEESEGEKEAAEARRTGRRDSRRSGDAAPSRATAEAKTADDTPQPSGSVRGSARVAPQRASRRAANSRVAPQRAAADTGAAAAPTQRAASQRTAPARAAPSRRAGSTARVAPQRASVKKPEDSRSSEV